MSFPTWSDLNDEPLIPPLGARRAPDINPVAVMVCTEPDVRLIESRAQEINGPGLRKNSFFLGRLFSAQDLGITFAGPYMGAPYAAMLLESLIARGAEKIVVMGWCGAISKEVGIGDVIIADAAIADEGTSRNYMDQSSYFSRPDDFPVVYPPDISYDIPSTTPGISDSLSAKLKRHLESNQITCKTGKVWTTDAIYRETAKKIAFFREKGAVVVEMECSALFSVAAFRKKEIAVVLLVSDDVSSNIWNPGFRNNAFKESRKKVGTALLNLSGAI